jgi:hypothetical protein
MEQRIVVGCMKGDEKILEMLIADFGDHCFAKKATATFIERVLLTRPSGPCNGMGAPYCSYLLVCVIPIVVTNGQWSHSFVIMEPLLDARSKLKLMDKIENKESINIGKKTIKLM